MLGWIDKNEKGSQETVKGRLEKNWDRIITFKIGYHAKH